MSRRHLVRHLTQAAFVCLGAALMPATLWASPAVDQPAPAFVGTGADGKPISLDSLKGKTVVLEWTNNDCPYVRKHYESGNIPALQKEAAAKGVVWLQVISSAPGTQGFVDGATAVKLNKSRGAAPANTVLDPDGKIGMAYGAQTTPHMFIIGPQSQLLYKGGIDSLATTDKSDIAKATPYVKTALNELAAGKKISTAVTRPYGCSIKYAS
jgi:hypothetical protein